MYKRQAVVNVSHNRETSKILRKHIELKPIKGLWASVFHTLEVREGGMPFQNARGRTDVFVDFTILLNIQIHKNFTQIFVVILK